MENTKALEVARAISDMRGGVDPILNESGERSAARIIQVAIDESTADLRAQLAERDAQLAALAWQSIETAPKDGTSILVGAPKGKPHYGDVDQVRWEVHFGHGAWLAIGGKADCGNYLDYEPTHWMTLPDAPATRQPTQDKGAVDEQA